MQIIICMSAARTARLNEKHEQLLRVEAQKPDNRECFDCTQKVESPPGCGTSPFPLSPPFSSSLPHTCSSALSRAHSALSLIWAPLFVMNAPACSRWPLPVAHGHHVVHLTHQALSLFLPLGSSSSFDLVVDRHSIIASKASRPQPSNQKK